MSKIDSLSAEKAQNENTAARDFHESARAIFRALDKERPPCGGPSCGDLCPRHDNLAASLKQLGLIGSEYRHLGGGALTGV